MNAFSFQGQHLFTQNQSALVAALIGGVSYFIVRYVRSPWRKLPPGPLGLPLLGNIFQLGEKQWLMFEKLKEKYGDLIYLNAAGQPIVVVNDHKIAADLLDRRAAIYSDRPRNIVASELMTNDLFIGFTRYNPTWRRMRKAAHEGLNKSIVQNYHHAQYTEALIFARNVLSEPKEWDTFLRRAAASSTMSIIYNRRPIGPHGDEAVNRINDFVQRLTRAALPGSYLVEFLPWMRYIPSSLAQWKKQVEDWYADDSAMFEELLTDVRDRMASGNHRSSLAGTLINEADRHGLSERENSWLAGAMYAAGAETTSAVLEWWMLAMVAYPEVQKRGQAELDEVVGRNRPPKFSDMQSLPYVRAMVKEALRWNSVDPVGSPHRSIEDDWYDGKFIPKGTIIIPNVWHINRDPSLFGPSVQHFDPSIHLDSNNQLAPGPADMKEEGHCTYGFGRRICVGRHVANNSLFIEMAMLLWGTNILPAKDVDGKPVPVDTEGCVEDGLVVRPAPFKCEIVPRFPEAATILATESDFVGQSA